MLLWLMNLGFAGGTTAVPAEPDPMSERYFIYMPAEDRSIEFPVDNREIEL